MTFFNQGARHIGQSYLQVTLAFSFFLSVILQGMNSQKRDHPSWVIGINCCRLSKEGCVGDMTSLSEARQTGEW